MAQKNRWHHCFLPDDYLRKMKQDLSEVEAQVESKARYEPDLDFSPTPEDDAPPTRHPSNRPCVRLSGLDLGTLLSRIQAHVNRYP